MRKSPERSRVWKQARRTLGLGFLLALTLWLAESRSGPRPSAAPEAPVQNGIQATAHNGPAPGPSMRANASAQAILHSAAAALPAKASASASFPVAGSANQAFPTNVIVQFNGQRYGFTADADHQLAAFQTGLGAGNSSVVLLGLLAAPAPTLRTAFAAQGVDLLAYVPDNGWIARIHGAEQGGRFEHVSFFRKLDAEMRIHTSLRIFPPPGAEVPVYVHLVPDRPGFGLISRLAAAGFDQLTVQSIGPSSYLAGKVGGAKLAEFLALTAVQPDVQLIERGSQARLLNDNAMRTTQSGYFLGGTPYFDHGIYGSNQVIAICDTGLDVDSCFFRDDTGVLPPTNRIDGTNIDLGLRKVIAADFLYEGDDPANPLDWDNHGHGTSVAGCAAGSEIYAPFDTFSNNGMAPGAKLIMQDAGYAGTDACADLVELGCPVTNFYPILLQAVAQGAVIHNDSWGDQEDAVQQNIYTEACRELDLVSWSNRQFLVVCAAGNNALSNTVGSPSVAKNSLSVAATMSGSSQEKIASYSSRGWASDGRFKPDLAVPGHNLSTAGSDGDITTDNCYLTGRSGTSFASPIVAGLAALVRDYFAQGFYPTGTAEATNCQPDVSAALVKAVLINSAVAMSNAMAAPPARDQGWGRVDLSQTLRLDNGARSLFAVDHPVVFEETPAFPYLTYLKLNSTNEPVKVTLVWTDYPATPGAEQHLVNDLDLRVRTHDFSLKGNVFTNGQSLAGGDYDRLNNVEQVLWVPATNGIVEISVWAHLIATGSQDFALVATGDFEVIPPTQDEDSDGLSDGWELWHFGNLEQTANGDPDLDHVPNAAEEAANTQPDDFNSKASPNLGVRDQRCGDVANERQRRPALYIGILGRC